MTILILAEYDDTYELARRFVNMGLPVAYYKHGQPDSNLDTNDVVHVSSWRPHLDDAQLVITDSPQLLLTYRTTKADAPILYVPRPWPRVQMPPEASDYLLSLMAGKVTPKRSWWRRNGRA